MERVTVGYLGHCLHPLWATSLDLRMARVFGAKSLWLPDHYTGFMPAFVWKPEVTAAAKFLHSLDAFFDPLQMLAVAATRFRGVDLATGVTEAFRRHPMSLAQSFVTLDHLSKGHAILGIGNGEKENVEPYGLAWEKQVSRLEEALTIIRLLWESQGTPVSYEGSFWKLRDAIFNLPLYNDKPPRIWVAAHAPRMLALTGRFADGWIPTEKISGSEYARRLEGIAQAATAAGRSMELFVPGQLLFPVVLGESKEQVIDMLMKSRMNAANSLCFPGVVWKEHGLVHPLGESHKGWREIVPARLAEEDVDRAMATVTPELILSTTYVGSPAEVVDEVAPLVDAGAQHLVVTNLAPAYTGGGVRDVLRLARFIRLLKRL